MKLYEIALGVALLVASYFAATMAQEQPTLSALSMWWGFLSVGTFIGAFIGPAVMAIVRKENQRP